MNLHNVILTLYLKLLASFIQKASSLFGQVVTSIYCFSKLASYYNNCIASLVHMAVHSDSNHKDICKHHKLLGLYSTTKKIDFYQTRS